MKLYESNSSASAKHHAQRQLEGRTHYVDDATLRYHHARILSTRAPDNGLLFVLIESVAVNPDNSKRGFRPVIFDLFGNVVNDRAHLDECYSTRKAAEKAMWAEVNAIDAKAVNLAALERAKKYQLDEWETMARNIAAT